MGKWKKIVAALAVIPLMAAIAPASNASELTTVNPLATQQAVGASDVIAPGKLADYTKDADLISSFDFNSVVANQTGAFTDGTGKATATVNGKAVITTGKDNSTALTLGSGNWLNLTNTDASAVLKGRHAVTISYDSKANQTSAGWTVFAAPSTSAQTNGKERYLGFLDQSKTITAERYNNTSGRITTANVSTSSNADWKHVDLVVTDEFSALFIDGVQQSVSNQVAGRSLPEILGDSGGVLQIGKGNWGGGEYFTGSIDNLKIYNSTDAAVADVLQRVSIPAEVDAGFTVPVSSNGVGISWVSDNAALAVDPATGDVSVTRPGVDEPDQSVTLTAKAGAASKEFTVVVRHTETDAEKAQRDLQSIDLGNLSDVRSSITLPVKGAQFASDIVWKSSQPNVISDTADGDIAPGAVTRPQDGDATVVLTASVAGADTVRRFVATVKQAVTATTPTDYLFVHFTGTEGKASDEQLYFATSQNGTQWTDTHSDGYPVLTSNLGEQGVRDPYLVRSPEGDTFYLIATDLSIYHRGGWGGHNPAANYDGSKDLIVWESHDLVTWTKPRAVDVASKIPHAAMAWAPEAYWIPELGEYMVYWATTSDQDDSNPQASDPTNMYYSLTRDFQTFSDPVKWIDRSQSVIDTTMIRADDGYYYRVSGDTYLGVERSKNPLATTIISGSEGYATGSDPNQWNLVGKFSDLLGNSAWTGAKLEGPELFRYNADDVLTNASGTAMKYGLMWDQYAEGKGYLPFRSADLGSVNTADWAAASDVNFGALKKRHGTILPITSTEYDAVMAAYNGKNSVSNQFSEEPTESKSLTVLDDRNAAASDVTVKLGDSTTLTAVVDDPDNESHTVTWEPADSSIVSTQVENSKDRSVSANTATFTGTKVGSTTVTASAAEDPTLKATFVINVTKADLHYEALQAAIAAAQSKQQSDFTSESWKALANALAHAKAALTEENASQGDVDAASAALVAATKALVSVTDANPTPKSDAGANQGADNARDQAHGEVDGIAETGSAVATFAVAAAMLLALGATLLMGKRRT